MTSPATPTAMQADFWSAAARHYRRVRFVPVTNGGDPPWSAVAVYAAATGLATDALYLARVDPHRLDALNARIRAQLQSGAFDPDTLYLLNATSHSTGTGSGSIPSPSARGSGASRVQMTNPSATEGDLAPAVFA